ncbi:MAG: beta-N-acetylhexosaminidase, partial [Gemmatimonadota bacterium]|nr:beta-N-acetylhexosaminidase [Gemmatimonadota bacterium]
MFRRLTPALLALGLPLPLAAQERPALLPLPATLEWRAGGLPLDSTFTVGLSGVPDPRLERAVDRAIARLEHRAGRALPRRVADPAVARLVIEVAVAGEPVQTPREDESYSLTIGAGSARLLAATTVGALRGLETLQQLVVGRADGFALPGVRIEDRPRFRWRGLLLDTGRHFMPPAVVRRTLDGMAAVKLNVLHWHLSEDQGFRVESRRFPRLHQLGSDGLYYTQEEIREIVAYAYDRGIRVMPEFDMPGHSTSWFVGYPEYASAPGPYQIERRFGVFEPAFDPTREATYQFLDSFIGEMTQLFPDPYWHIGGDEVVGKHWDRNPRILRYKRTHGLRDNEALQAHFNDRLSKILARHHRILVGWDEILHPGLPAGSVVQSWRGTEYLGRAARQGMGAILSAPYYLDHMKTAEEHYLADPLPAGHGLSPEEEARVLGAEACMWAEHVNQETVDSRIWPRLAALAERFWSPAGVRDVDDMYRRLSLASIGLERVGLTHEAHTYRMLRLLAGRRGVQPLHDLLHATMPVSFGERGRLQGTTQLTPFSRLVDAARPDPWLRSRLNQLARTVTADLANAPAARAELQRTFDGWQPLEGQVVALADTLPLAADGIPAARALGELGRLGREALGRLERGGGDDGWRAATRARLDTLAAPQGLLRL